MKVKLDRLAARKRELKTELQEAQEKEQAFVARMDRHMDEVDRSEARLEKMCSELRLEYAQLARTLDHRGEHFDVADKDRVTGMGKLVNKLTYLMQQGEHSDGATRRSPEGEVVDGLKTQLEEVLKQNHDLATRLSDEQRLCTRLHQSLYDTQQEHFS